MKSAFHIRTLIVAISFFVIPFISMAAPGNDLCGAPTNINPVTSCGYITAQSLYQATSTGSPTTTCGATFYDVWYTFTAPIGITSVTISVNLPGGSNLNNTTTYVEVFNATTCANVITSNSMGCS